MPESVLDAIRQGQWDFEPEEVHEEEYDSTAALPGSNEKISELATRASEGLPLWHPADRRCFDDTDEALSQIRVGIELDFTSTKEIDGEV